MWIFVILIILFLICGLVFATALYAALLTSLIWMFLKGLEIVTTPQSSCLSQCFKTVYDSKQVGWVLLTSPVLIISFLIFYKITKKNVSK